MIDTTGWNLERHALRAMCNHPDNPNATVHMDFLSGDDIQLTLLTHNDQGLWTLAGVEITYKVVGKEALLNLVGYYLDQITEDVFGQTPSDCGHCGQYIPHRGYCDEVCQEYGES